MDKGKGWSSSLGLCKGITMPHHKIQLVIKCYTGPQTWMDSLKHPRQWKMGMRFGAWNVRSVCRAGSLKTVTSESA